MGMFVGISIRSSVLVPYDYCGYVLCGTWYYVFSVQNVLQNVPCMLSFFNLQEVGLALGVRVCSIYK